MFNWGKIIKDVKNAKLGAPGTSGGSDVKGKFSIPAQSYLLGYDTPVVVSDNFFYNVNVFGRAANKLLPTEYESLDTTVPYPDHPDIETLDLSTTSQDLPDPIRYYLGLNWVFSNGGYVYDVPAGPGIGTVTLKNDFRYRTPPIATPFQKKTKKYGFHGHEVVVQTSPPLLFELGAPPSVPPPAWAGLHEDWTWFYTSGHTPSPELWAWTEPQVGDTGVAASSGELAKIEYTLFKYYRQYLWMRPVDTQENIENLRQHRKLTGNYPEGEIYSNKPFVDYIEPLMFPNDNFYIDTATRISFPMSSKCAEALTEIKKEYVRITPIYNYYAATYESAIETAVLAFGGLDPSDERMLPNIYAFLSTQKNNGNLQQITGDPTLDPYLKHLTLNGKRTDSKAPSLLNINSYLKEWSRDMKRVTSDDIHDIGVKYRTIGISPEHLELLKLAEENKDKFPMYNEIEISAMEGNRKFVQLLKKSDLFDEFMSAIMYAVAPRTPVSSPIIPGLGTKNKRPVAAHSILREDTSPSKENYMYSQEKLINFDLKHWLYTYLLKNDPTATGTTLSTFDEVNGLQFSMSSYDDLEKYLTLFGKETDNVFLGSQFGEGFIKALNGMLFKAELNKFVEENMRSVQDVYHGKLAYSETLMYEIVKYSVNPQTGDQTFKQNIFLPNDPGLDVLNYIDTQVKRNVEYVYKVYAHRVVLGTKYKTALASSAGGGVWDTMPKGEQLNARWKNRFSVRGEMRYEPILHLVRVPFYNTFSTNHGGVVYNSLSNTTEYNLDSFEKTIIKDKPPVFPNVDIVPLKGKKNKVLINLNFNAGEYFLNPIVLDSLEEKGINLIRKAQGIETGPILYKTDEYRGTFEIYRTDVKPRAYLDFAPIEEKRIASLDSLQETTFVDTIEPNKDYYYTFRVIDVHENISNPTPVYSARIISDPGLSPYLVINSHHINDLGVEDQELYKESIPAKKLLHIKPSFEQTFVDQDDYSSPEMSARDVQIAFGNREETIFGKKFKFRFTSKKTGKKFDINVTVKSPSQEIKQKKTAMTTSALMLAKAGLLLKKLM
jgi:hypothetical protein